MDVLCDDVWCLFHHAADNMDWTNKSYNLLATISSADDFWKASFHIVPVLQSHIFFLTREHIFPVWDDPCNIDGGCWSVRVPCNKSAGYWERICTYAMTESIHDDPCIVNGISCSFKHKWCVFKIWVNTSVEFTELNVPDGYHGGAIYKSNRQSIEMDHR